MKLSGGYRQELEAVPGIPLPFYVRSIGTWILEEGETHFTGGVKSNTMDLLWCESGRGEINRTMVGANDIFWFLPGEDREYHALSKRWKWRWVCFDGPLAEANFFAFKLPRLIHGSHCPTELYEKIFTRVSSALTLDAARLSGLLMELLIRVAEENRRQTPDKTLLSRCIEFIRRNFTDPGLDLSLLSEQFRIPRSTLSKLFRDNMHRSPGVFIRDCRSSQGIALLRGTKLTVAEIARRSGYSDVVSFSRLIRRRTGASPSRLRESNLAEPGRAEGS